MVLDEDDAGGGSFRHGLSVAETGAACVGLRERESGNFPGMIARNPAKFVARSGKMTARNTAGAAFRAGVRDQFGAAAGALAVEGGGPCLRGSGAWSGAQARPSSFVSAERSRACVVAARVPALQPLRRLIRRGSTASAVSSRRAKSVGSPSRGPDARESRGGNAADRCEAGWRNERCGPSSEGRISSWSVNEDRPIAVGQIRLKISSNERISWPSSGRARHRIQYSRVDPSAGRARRRNKGAPCRR